MKRLRSWFHLEGSARTNRQIVALDIQAALSLPRISGRLPRVLSQTQDAKRERNAPEQRWRT